MDAKDIPGFIFRSAVLSVDGKEQVIRDYSLERPVINGRIAREDVLYLRFKSGLEMEFDAARVKEIPGRIPDFLKPGKKIFLRETLRDQFSKAVNGTWEISRVSVKQGNDGQVYQLLIGRPSGTSRTTYISRTFNSDTMSSVDDGAPLSRDETPAKTRRGPISAPPTARFRKAG